MANWLTAGIGLGTGLLGGIFGASEAESRKKALSKIAATPGINLEQVNAEALGAMETAFPTATALGSKINAYYSDELQKALEAAYPGRAGQMAQYSGLVGDLMGGGTGVLDTARESLRRSATAGVGGGTIGSQFQGANALRLNYNQMLQNMLTGMGAFQQSASAFPYASPTDISGLLGYTPAQATALRSSERADAMRYAAAAAGSEGALSTLGSTLSGLGGTLAGYGLGSIGRTSSSWPTGLAYGDVTGYRSGVGVGNPYGDVMRGLYD